MDGRKNGSAYWVMGVAAVAGLLLAGSLLCRRVQAADPVGRANRLLTLCNDKLSEIETSLEHLQATVQSAA